jgi:hypothetical protein
VARDARHWSIRVAADSTVVRIRLRLAAVRPRVAGDAREDGIVRGGSVTVRAHRPVVRLLEPGMVERRAEPIRGNPSGVASYAGGWVLRGNVIRYCATKRLRAQPGRLVTSVAIGVRGGKCIVVVDVAR